MKKFGLEERFQTGSLNVWQKVKPRVWALFEEPYSSSAAKVSSWNHIHESELGYIEES